MADVSQICEFRRLTAGATPQSTNMSRPNGRSQIQTRVTGLVAFLPAIRNIFIDFVSIPTIPTIPTIPMFIDAGGPNSTFSVSIDGGSPTTIASTIINGGTF